MLAARFKKVRRLGRHLAELDEADLHRLRIRIKKLRYCGEFFRALYPERAARPFLENVAALQDSLGYLNDQVTARTLIAELNEAAEAKGRKADLAWAAGAIQGWHAHEAKRSLRRAGKQWRRLKRQGPFWQ
jgi:CHAD domain-containing protein